MSFDFRPGGVKRKNKLKKNGSQSPTYTTGFISDDGFVESPTSNEPSYLNFNDISTPPAGEKKKQIRSHTKDESSDSRSNISKSKTNVSYVGRFGNQKRNPSMISNKRKKLSENQKIVIPQEYVELDEKTPSSRIFHRNYSTGTDKNDNLLLQKNKNKNNNSHQPRQEHTPVSSHNQQKHTIEKRHTDRYSMDTKQTISEEPPQSRSSQLQFTKQNGRPKKGTKIIPGVSLKPEQTSGIKRHKLARFANSSSKRGGTNIIRKSLAGLGIDDTARKNGLDANTLKQTRKISRNKRKTDQENPIDLCGDSSDCDSSQDYFDINQAKLKREQENTQDCSWDCIRIAVNNKVFSSGCSAKVNFQNKESKIVLSFGCCMRTETKSKEQKLRTKSVPLKCLKRIRYFIADDNDNELSPDEANKEKEDDTDCTSLLDDFTNILVMEFIVGDTHNILILELRSDEVFKEAVAVAQKHEYINDDSKLTLSQVKKHASALIDDTIRDEKHRLNSLSKRRSRRLDTLKEKKSKKERIPSEKKIDADIPILIFPFDANPNVYDQASESLTEAAGKCCRFENDDVIWFSGSSSKPIKDNTNENMEAINEIPKTGKLRKHFLTINNEDLNRLDSGEFLNDTLIDFWMRWISKDEDPSISEVHFFTSHFFTALADGPEAVSSWTAKKNINIFQKKLLFIPINAHLHWSLCVILNCDKMIQWTKEPSQFDEIPCLLFFDSLKAHRKQRVANTLRKWLKFEAHRLQISVDEEAFSNYSLRIVAPCIPYQNNSWDCGVFVCRFAYSLYLLRSKKFTYHDLRARRPFDKIITQSPEFSFGPDDIVRLRREMQILVSNLSGSFIEQKELEKKARKKNEKKKIKDTSSLRCSKKDETK